MLFRRATRATFARYAAMDQSKQPIPDLEIQSADSTMPLHRTAPKPACERTCL